MGMDRIVTIMGMDSDARMGIYRMSSGIRMGMSSGSRMERGSGIGIRLMAACSFVAQIFKTNV
jgi:hypothetical protein